MERAADVALRLAGRHAGMVFVADDLAAWLVFILAEAGRKRLTSLVLGDAQQRTLRSAATAAVQRTAAELRPDDAELADQVAMVISQVFSEPVQDSPLARQATLLEALQAGIAGQLAVLDDASLTGTGQSSADVLGVPGTVVAAKLTSYLLQEILALGSRGGPLVPLANQLNHDFTHLQGERIEEVLGRLDNNVRKALTYVNLAITTAAPDDRSRYLVGVMPPTAECFQDRDQARQLREPEGDQNGTSWHVLIGTGGVGKTQLAAHYARRVWRAGKIDVLVWVSATSRAMIVSQYAQAASAVTGAGLTDLDRAASRFQAWMQTTDKRWLVVLNEVADPADARGLWPPDNPHGQVILTTRRRDAVLTDAGRKVIDIGVFSPDQSVAYLTAKLAAHPEHNLDDPDQIAGLADDLGNLPLALAQAAAYLIDEGMDCATYRQLLADRRRTLQELEPANSGLPDDQSNALSATWSLSLDLADQQPPHGLARPMLRLASMLDPNGIPEAILLAPAVLDYLAVHRARADQRTNQSAPPVPAADARRVIRCLHRLGLAEHTWSRPPQMVRVHSLLQRVTRDSCTGQELDQLAQTAASAIYATWPENERDSALTQAMRSNTEFLYDNAAESLWHEQAHPVLLRAGQSIGQSGLLVSAGLYYEKLLAAAISKLGPDHPDTLMIRANRARWRGRLDPVTSSTECADLARDYERILGPQHRETLNARFWQAYWAGEAGNVTGAGQALQQLLEDQTRMLGPDDQDTLRTRHNLIWFYCRHVEWEDDSRRVDAWTEMNRLLEDEVRVLGSDHPDTLTTRYAIATMAAGHVSPLQTIYDVEGILQDQVRVLGPDHPDTLASRYTLTYSRNLMNSFTPDGVLKSKAETKGLVEDLCRVLGPDHHLVFNARAMLAHRFLLGDPVGEESAYQELLNDQLRVFGPDHPEIEHTRQALQFARWRATKYREANKLPETVPRGKVMSDNGRFSHYLDIEGHDLGEAISKKTPVTALCGWSWVPKRFSQEGDGTNNLPVCPDCKSIHDSPF